MIGVRRAVFAMSEHARGFERAPCRKAASHRPVRLSSLVVQVQVKETTPATLSLLTDLVQGFRRPALFGTEQGALLCMNAAAVRRIAHAPSATEDVIPADWPRRLTLQVDGHTFHLVAPDPSEGATSLPSLPPRLAKIAKMVIAGSTDKQIASRTGLSFSTVRTYVRQIYRRFGVHSRVELVHAMRD